MQHEGEEPAGVVRELLEGVEDLLGAELHDLPAEVDDPDDLLVLLQDCFREVDEALVEVPDEFIIGEGFDSP